MTETLRRNRQLAIDRDNARRGCERYGRLQQLRRGAILVA
jgi:hypothetical protein